jgi:hypothetical protein
MLDRIRIPVVEAQDHGGQHGDDTKARARAKARNPRLSLRRGYGFRARNYFEPSVLLVFFEPQPEIVQKREHRPSRNAPTVFSIPS